MAKLNCSEIDRLERKFEGHCSRYLNRERQADAEQGADTTQQNPTGHCLATAVAEDSGCSSSPEFLDMPVRVETGPLEIGNQPVIPLTHHRIGAQCSPLPVVALGCGEVSDDFTATSTVTSTVILTFVRLPANGDMQGLEVAVLADVDVHVLNTGGRDETAFEKGVRFRGEGTETRHLDCPALLVQLGVVGIGE